MLARGRRLGWVADLGHEAAEGSSRHRGESVRGESVVLPRLVNYGPDDGDDGDDGTQTAELSRHGRAKSALAVLRESDRLDLSRGGRVDGREYGDGDELWHGGRGALGEVVHNDGEGFDRRGILFAGRRRGHCDGRGRDGEGERRLGHSLDLGDGQRLGVIDCSPEGRRDWWQEGRGQLRRGWVRSFHFLPGPGYVTSWPMMSAAGWPDNLVGRLGRSERGAYEGEGGDEEGGTHDCVAVCCGWCWELCWELCDDTRRWTF